MANIPRVVANNATQADQLDLAEVALLGTIVGPRGPQALLRMGSGRIRKVSAGDRLGLGFTRVLAIGNGQLQLASGGTVQTLTIPGS
ncbi:amidophosphoribosyltransferase [Pseudooceanicola sediminis]|uniref:Amidophosphoribosyltransferase n=1 Tax=Pseudooceanicola sediminis TaxID=2211117 RepID=A0A399IZ65_9RHOB|nr:amidophosphoribosyltransferase [Pseudooceanicola sediminis]KAA2316145.1 pilus assembly protein PilP [Puniceibacterium sp. HSS470]RII38254.1 amidophosphoribosyltransferase [Pseudooceanicola sediminis]|tara:strand:- start:29 stop:289 length:261 start_codon:yes stop_codon:yes gene_type:complete